MNALSFILSGKTACFRKPDVNAYAYFTYNNIHKPALLGLLGAVMGLGGYTQLHDKNAAFKKGRLGYDEGFPEFYEKLHPLKISITPLAPNGYFAKKIQTFNNSVGYASQEQGGNLVVREQWLEKPQWQIMILDDGSESYQKLCDYLMNKKSVFIPYLGKNDHPSTIDGVEILSLDAPIETIRITSLFQEKSLIQLSGAPRGELSFYFKETSPHRLQKEHHFYEYENLILTNHTMAEGDFSFIFSHEGKNYAFI